MKKYLLTFLVCIIFCLCISPAYAAGGYSRAGVYSIQSATITTDGRSFMTSLSEEEDAYILDVDRSIPFTYSVLLSYDSLADLVYRCNQHGCNVGLYFNRQIGRYVAYVNESTYFGIPVVGVLGNADGYVYTAEKPSTTVNNYYTNQYTINNPTARPDPSIGSGSYISHPYYFGDIPNHFYEDVDFYIKHIDDYLDILLDWQSLLATRIYNIYKQTGDAIIPGVENIVLFTRNIANELHAFLPRLDDIANNTSLLAIYGDNILSRLSIINDRIDLMSTNTYVVGYLSDLDGVPFPTQSIPYEVATQIVARMNSELMGKSVLHCTRDGSGVFNVVFSRASISSDGRICVYCTNGYYYYLCDESNTIFVVDPKTDYGDYLANIYSRLDTLNTAITSGFSTLVGYVDGVEGKLDISNSRLSTLNTSITSGFSTLVGYVDGVGGKLDISNSRLSTLDTSITSGFSNVSGKLDTVIDLMSTNTYVVGYLSDLDGVPYPTLSIPYETATQIVARLNSEMIGRSIKALKRDGSGYSQFILSRSALASNGCILVYSTSGSYYYLCDNSNTIFVVDPKTDYGDSLGDIYSRMTDIISAVNNLTVGIDLSDVSLEVDASSINLFNNDAYCCGYQTDSNGNKYATYAIPYDTATALIERLNTDYVGKRITVFSRSGSSSVGYLRSATLLSTGYIQVKLTNGYSEYSARDCAPQPLRLSRHSGRIEQARRWR